MSKCVFCKLPLNQATGWQDDNPSCDCDECGAMGGCFDCLVVIEDNNLCPNCDAKETCAICEKYFARDEMSYDDDLGMFCCENPNCVQKFWKD
jgi:hypothetical protein